MAEYSKWSICCNLTTNLVTISNVAKYIRCVEKRCNWLRNIIAPFLWLLQNQLSRGVLGKGVPKICSKFTGEHRCLSVISIVSTLLKSHFSMGVLLQIYYIFSEHLLLRKPLNGCFCYCYVLWTEVENGGTKKDWRDLAEITITSIFILFLEYWNP